MSAMGMEGGGGGIIILKVLLLCQANKVGWGRRPHIYVEADIE